MSTITNQNARCSFCTSGTVSLKSGDRTKTVLQHAVNQRLRKMWADRGLKFGDAGYKPMRRCCAACTPTVAAALGITVRETITVDDLLAEAPAKPTPDPDFA